MYKAPVNITKFDGKYHLYVKYLNKEVKDVHVSFTEWDKLVYWLDKESDKIFKDGGNYKDISDLTFM